MNRATRFILLMGIVSLLGDITYEGGRSVVGPFLATFGVSAVLVGFISGFGEFAGYAFRLLSGYVADRTKRYWPMTFLGYAMILCIPLLVLANRWEIAAVLIILERLGKAIRSPPRDAMLSFATREIGRGWGFAIHEAMDQIGAVIGPLILSAALLKYNYQEGFAVLAIPALATIAVLTFARFQYPSPRKFEEKRAEVEEKDVFWLYTLFVFSSVMGFASFPIIAYHFKVNSVFSDSVIPLLYAVAMGIDAVSALIAGRAYDRIGFGVLIAIPLLIPLTLLSFTDLALFGVVVWGAVMGMQETVMRASVADLVKLEKRSTAYGIFNTAYGFAWLAGGVIIGALYEMSFNLLTAFVVSAEFAALVVLYAIVRKMRTVMSV
ncbi:MFS transporter [Archaeoglobus neptunius]|uniref:MFS transporter n=1 Tax=Archaeoglobus neptunius TaxID=2798580 RepID=UPI0019262100|nr:MFS transporter [Archaeoglobus neptunius]